MTKPNSRCPKASSSAAALLVLLGGIGLSIFLFVVLNNAEKSDHTQSFLGCVSTAVNTFEGILLVESGKVFTTVGFFLASRFVDRDEFNLFTSRLVNSTSTIDQMNWAPIVSQSERVQTEQTAAAELGSSTPLNFTGLVSNATCDRQIDSIRSSYIPILYMNPAPASPSSFLFNLNTDLAFLDTRDAVIQSDQPLISGLICNVGPDESLPGLRPMIVSQVVKGSILGYILATIQTDVAVRRAFDTSALASCSFCISVVDHTSQAEPSYWASACSSPQGPVSVPRGTVPENTPGTPIRSNQVTVSRVIAGRLLVVTAINTEPQQPSGSLVAVVILTLVMSLICAIAVFLYRSRQSVLNQKSELLAEVDAIYHSAPVGIAVTDQNRRFVRANNAIVRLGRTHMSNMPESSDAVVGMELALLNADFASLIEPAIQEVFHTGKPVLDYEIALTVSDCRSVVSNPSSCDQSGGVGPVTSSMPLTEMNQSEIVRDVTMLASVFPIHRGGLLVNVGLICDDVSTLVTQRSAAIKQSKAKDLFLAQMSHEIRTPMGGILGTLDLLLDPRFSGRASLEEQREHLFTLKHSTDLLMALLNDMLDLSKIEHQQLFLELESNSLLQTIANCVDVVKTKEDVILILDVDPCFDMSFVEFDRMRVSQIFYNLLGNANKFTKRGSIRVYLTSKPAEPTQDVRTINYTVTVTDTGCGIAEHAREKVFELFLQADNSIARKFGGTGLGLSIVRNLVHMMGGDVWVSQTELGVGSTFTITFALQRSHTPLSGNSLCNGDEASRTPTGVREACSSVNGSDDGDEGEGEDQSCGGVPVGTGLYLTTSMQEADDDGGESVNKGIGEWVLHAPVRVKAASVLIAMPASTKVLVAPLVDALTLEGADTVDIALSSEALIDLARNKGDRYKMVLVSYDLWKGIHLSVARDKLTADFTRPAYFPSSISSYVVSVSCSDPAGAHRACERMEFDGVLSRTSDLCAAVLLRRIAVNLRRASVIEAASLRSDRVSLIMLSPPQMRKVQSQSGESHSSMQEVATAFPDIDEDEERFLSHRASFSQTNLSHSSLSSANLSHTSLSSTNLSHTNLSHTSLSHTNLSRTSLARTASVVSHASSTSRTDLLVAAATSDSAAEPLASGIPHLHILIVEDNFTNQKVVSAIVRRVVPHCTIEFADDGDEGVQAYKNNVEGLTQHFDLILMDCQMPRMSGYVATQHIRRFEKTLPSTTRIPIVALTAHAMAKDREKCIQYGMDEYMTKPVSINGMRTLFGRLGFDVDEPKEAKKKKKKKKNTKSTTSMELPTQVVDISAPTSASSIQTPQSSDPDVSKYGVPYLPSTTTSVSSIPGVSGAVAVSRETAETAEEFDYDESTV